MGNKNCPDWPGSDIYTLPPYCLTHKVVSKNNLVQLGSWGTDYEPQGFQGFLFHLPNQRNQKGQFMWTWMLSLTWSHHVSSRCCHAGDETEPSKNPLPTEPLKYIIYLLCPQAALVEIWVKVRLGGRVVQDTRKATRGSELALGFLVTYQKDPDPSGLFVDRGCRYSIRPFEMAVGWKIP